MRYSVVLRQDDEGNWYILSKGIPGMTLYARAGLAQHGLSLKEQEERQIAMYKKFASGEWTGLAESAVLDILHNEYDRKFDNYVMTPSNHMVGIDAGCSFALAACGYPYHNESITPRLLRSLPRLDGLYYAFNWIGSYEGGIVYILTPALQEAVEECAQSPHFRRELNITFLKALLRPDSLCETLLTHHRDDDQSLSKAEEIILNGGIRIHETTDTYGNYKRYRANGLTQRKEQLCEAACQDKDFAELIRDEACCQQVKEEYFAYLCELTMTSKDELVSDEERVKLQETMDAQLAVLSKVIPAIQTFSEETYQAIVAKYEEEQTRARGGRLLIPTRTQASMENIAKAKDSVERYHIAQALIAADTVPRSGFLTMIEKALAKQAAQILKKETPQITARP